MHKSRLAGFIIDCQTPATSTPPRVLEQALGLCRSRRRSAGGTRTASSTPGAPGLHIEVQKVDAPEPRAPRHRDRRHRGRGASASRRSARSASSRSARWWVMEAPTGQRFCVVRPQRPDFAEANARTYLEVESAPRDPQPDPFPSAARSAARGRARARRARRRDPARAGRRRSCSTLVEQDRVVADRPPRRRCRRPASELAARVRGRPPHAGARSGARLLDLVPGREPRGEGASHPPAARVFPEGQRAPAAGRRRGCARGAEGAGLSLEDVLALHRHAAASSRCSPRIPPNPRAARSCASSSTSRSSCSDRLDPDADAERNAQPLGRRSAPSSPPAGRPRIIRARSSPSRTSASTCSSISPRSCIASCRRSTRRSRRRSRSSTACRPTSLELPVAAAFRHVGRR